MRTAIRVCLKDLRHFWPQAAVVILLVALRALLDILLPLHLALFALHTFMFQILMLLAYFVITALVVHDDPLVGDRQIWLTRPISWQSLLWGKIIFLLLVINLPVLIFQSAAMILNGLSPRHHLAALGLEQLSLLATLAVAALLASVTRSLAQFAMSVLAMYAVESVLPLLVGPRFLQSVLYDWGSTGAARDVILAAVFIPFPAALIWLQYSRRATRSVITASVGALLLVELLPGVNLWYPVAQWRARMAGTLHSQSPVTVSLLPGQSHEYKVGWITFGQEEGSGVNLPVRVTGIPQGRTLVNERMNFTVVAPDGSTWESGWVEIGGINMMAFPSHRQQVIPVNGDYWLAVNVNRAFYERVRDEVSRARVSLAFRLVGPPVEARLPSDRMPLVCNGDGRCGLILVQGQYQVVCLFAEQPTALLLFGYVRIRLSETGSSTIWRYTATGPAFNATALSSRAALTLFPEEAWFETTLDIPEIRLGDHYVQRSRP